MEFDPQKVLIDWKDGRGFTLADAQSGTLVTGATGSGKTSGPGKMLSRAFLRAGMGGLVLCSKPDEPADWIKLAAEAGRSADLILVEPDGKARFNFLDWEATQNSGGPGFAINVVSLLDEIATAIDPGSGTSAGDGGDNAFFQLAHRHLLTNLVDLPMLAGLPVSMRLMRAIVNSAPMSIVQRDDPNWQRSSACWQMLREADEATKGNPEKLADFEECRTFFLNDFCTLSDRTRSILLTMFSVLIRPYVTRPLRRLFCEDTTVRPEDIFDGKIIVVALPVQTYRLVGRMAALTWKWTYQVSVMRRALSGAPFRPTFLYADEAQNFITERDAEYQAVARSAGGCTVYLTQQREGIRRVLKSNDATDNLLANLQTKWFCQNSGDTNRWAADLIGQRYVKITTTNVGRSGQHGDVGLAADINAQAGISRSEQLRYFVEPSRFSTLKRGGPPHDKQVEAILYGGGRLFEREGEEPLPYKLVTFRQQ